MSDIQTITKFESLPNEILIECFEYLNAIDIFNAFDYLNSRFHHLIRYIPLHLNVDEIKQSTLAQFGTKMLLNPQIKTQIISLKLSGNNIFDNIGPLFSFTSMNEFPHLRALILSNLTLDMDSHISSKLPLLLNLRYFCLKNSNRGKYKILESLPTSIIRTLSIPKLPDSLPLTYLFTSLVNLTVSSCTVKELREFFKYSPGLQYLDIRYLDEPLSSTIANEPQSLHNQAVHLKSLVISDVYTSFDDLEILLQHTPNLKLLMVSADNDFDIVDAYRWRKLIDTSLSLLDVFKFQFGFYIEDEDHVILDKFQQFQNEFWHHQHHWYTEYVLSKDRAIIYTVPYMSNEYAIISDTRIYFNKSFNSATALAKVTDLKLNIGAMTNSGEYYQFPNVKSLRLRKTYVNVNHAYPYLKTKHIKCLKTMVNLSNLVHLEIPSQCRWKSPSVMLQLLKGALNLSSLRVNKTTLFSMFKNHELCEYLAKMIKKLDISFSRYYDDYPNLDESAKICQILSNVEEFRCNVGFSDNLEMISNQLSKLTYIKVFSYKTAYISTRHQWLKLHKSELDLYSFIIKCESEHYEDYRYYSNYHPLYHDQD
jgi:hypothetical protein